MDNYYSWSAGGTAADGDAFTNFIDDLNSTGFAGQHDWRLPTLFELQTIVATDAVPCGTAPCVADPLFSPTQSHNYWSSSTYQDFPRLAWDVYISSSNGVALADKPRTQLPAALPGVFERLRCRPGKVPAPGHRRPAAERPGAAAKGGLPGESGCGSVKPAPWT